MIHEHFVPSAKLCVTFCLVIRVVLPALKRNRTTDSTEGQNLSVLTSKDA